MEWKDYLEGAEKPITIYTNHENLQYLLTKKAMTHRQIPWAQKLFGSNFQIIYLRGTKGGKPDPLTRGPESSPENGAMYQKQNILQP